MQKLAAILLIGPTGAGKSPLGDYFEANGIFGHRCFHFDFGENLRQVDAGNHLACHGRLSTADLQVVRQSLHGGTLLENEHFHIARDIYLSFVKSKGVSDEDFILMNGLPRHVGQALDVDSMVNINQLIVMQSSAEVVRQRIASNSGGDRTGRVDDDAAAVEKKLALFARRTQPVIEHYKQKGATIWRVKIDISTRPKDVAEHIHISGWRLISSG